MGNRPLEGARAGNEIDSLNLLPPNRREQVAFWAPDLLRNFSKRAPSRAEALPVFRLVLLLQFSWTMVVFLFNLPSWLLAIPLSDILAQLSYGLVFALADSLLIFGSVVVLSRVLPASWIRDDFPASGGMLAAVLFFWILVFQLTLTELLHSPPAYIASILGLAVVSSTAFVLAARRLKPIRAAVLWLGTASEVLAYLYLALSASGLAAVAVRNFF